MTDYAAQAAVQCDAAVLTTSCGDCGDRDRERFVRRGG